MSTRIIESMSPEDTFNAGKLIGENAKPGTVICLNGDLGTGKTVFTQGVAKGLGVSGPVNSPTFTIVQIYEDGRMPLYHFDVYRIEEPEEMEEIGYTDYFYGEGLTIIEWSELISEIIPENAVQITLKKDLGKGFDYRLITVKEQD